MKKILICAAAAALSACSANAEDTALLDAPAAETAAILANEAPALTADFAQSEAFYEAPATIVQIADDLNCDVRAIPTRHGVRLEATAYSSGPISGGYEFTIRKRDSAGSSDIMQAGEFDLISGETQPLGDAEFSIGDDGGYSATLVLFDEAGIACSTEHTG